MKITELRRIIKEQIQLALTETITPKEIFDVASTKNLENRSIGKLIGYNSHTLENKKRYFLVFLELSHLKFGKVNGKLNLFVFEKLGDNPITELGHKTIGIELPNKILDLKDLQNFKEDFKLNNSDVNDLVSFNRKYNIPNNWYNTKGENKSPLGIEYDFLTLVRTYTKLELIHSLKK